MATASSTTSAAYATCEAVTGARESAVRLLALLQATGADPGRQRLAEQIIRCIDTVLAAVHGAGDSKKRGSAHGPTVHRPLAGSKRRMTACRGELGTRVVSSTTDDGFAWRKYGEKIVNHHRYRRSYFRCTYRDDHGCGAKKHVQRTQENPSLFEITYFGKHTPACPRNAPVDDDTSSPGAASGRLCPDDDTPLELSLPAEEKELMVANVAQLSKYCPTDDQLMKLVSANDSFTSAAGALESVDDNLEELISLLCSA